MSLTVFACYDDAYASFVPLFKASLVWSNPHASVECKRCNFPQYRRFIDTPEVCSDYVLITDIDMIFLEPIEPKHLQRMEETGLPYSNVLRESYLETYFRMTGIHFSKWEAYYPIPTSILSRAVGCDEAFLAELVLQRHGLPPKSDRIWNGIHLTPHRGRYEPKERWRVEEWRETMKAFLQSEQYKGIANQLDGLCKKLLYELIDCL